MMKTNSSLFFLSACVFVLFFVFTGIVFAHGDEPRLEISADRLNPGAVLDLRGVDFEYEEQVALALVGAQGEIPFGSVIADTEGIFLLTITLPVDLQEGTYVMRATTDDHVVDSPEITIWGTAILEGGEQGPRDEEDGLLAPMPTNAPVVATQAPPADAHMQSEPPKSSFMPVLWIAIGIGLVLLAGMILRARRSL